MFNLGRILSEHRPVVVLLVLVGASLLSLIRGTEASVLQRGVARFVSLTSYPFLVVKNNVRDNLSGVYEFVAEYQEIKKETRTLNDEVARLKGNMARMAMLEEENGRLRGMLHFVRENPLLTLEPVSILESYKGMLRIDRGAVHGVKPSMCVVTEEGVVGVVTEVADFTATVATLHHMDCKVGAMVMRNRLRAYDGVVHASGNDLSRICTMEYIDMKEEVKVGDVVVTSPESLFPAGYLIGRISAIHSTDGSLWKNADVIPAIDPYRLDEVFLIRRTTDDADWQAAPKEDYVDILTKAQETQAQEAEKSSETARNKAAQGAPAPDIRTMQERYSP